MRFEFAMALTLGVALAAGASPAAEMMDKSAGGETMEQSATDTMAGTAATASSCYTPSIRCTVRYPNAGDRNDHRVNGWGYISCKGIPANTVQMDNYAVNSSGSHYDCTFNAACPNPPYPSDSEFCN